MQEDKVSNQEKPGELWPRLTSLSAQTLLLYRCRRTKVTYSSMHDKNIIERAVKTTHERATIIAKNTTQQAAMVSITKPYVLAFNHVRQEAFN